MSSIDLVYILGTGSNWNNNEIRFSLRSVEKNLIDVRNVYVIGENPGFLTDKVIHIYHPDPLSGHNADGNMALKILRACREDSLSDDFLFMNDDFIINKPVVASEIKWMHKGNMKNRPENFWKTEFYRLRLRRTFDVLLDRGLPTMQYDYHAPMLMNKYLFPKVMSEFNFCEDIGYTFRSLYGNYLGLPGTNVRGQKVTVYKYYNIDQLSRLVENYQFIGFNDLGLNISLKIWLWLNFKEISIYEKQDTDDIAISIYRWLHSDQNYREGVKLYCRVVRAKNLQLLFLNRETPELHRKLVYKLNQRLSDLYEHT